MSQDTHTEFTNPRLKKLWFRAWRRGFREADLILGPYADKHLARMTPEELDLFEALLETPDQDLYGYLIKRTQAPLPLDHAVMHQIQDFVATEQAKIDLSNHKGA